MIYIAAPYNHIDKTVIQSRMELIYRIMGEHIMRGEHVVTPLFMHEVATRYELPGDYIFWERYCLNMLRRCDKMIILCIDGWKESRGVTGEIEFCKANNIPIEFLEIK